MNGKLKYVTFDTRMGWVGILGSPEGIRRTTLPQASADAARQRLGKEAAGAEPSHHLFENLTARLKRYFQGERASFPDELNLTGATPFQVRVWQAARLIPHGETRSYRWLAAQAGNQKAARAVGTALARNPLPIIVPCHRVVASNGGLGGFSGGLEMKRRLLSLEAQVNMGEI
jgi:methylated-DNA-[protein]-cysteine S-methyltransferase